jgi:type II secretory pathway pseudopilin PulG
MKRRLTQIVGSLLVISTLLGIGVPTITAQDWRRERREERQAERVQRAFIRGVLGSIRGQDRDRRVRYQYNGGRRLVGYHDRWGNFHAVGFYDRYGNFWRYR